MTGDPPPHRDYPRPPIIEALCQITFEPLVWNVASPGQLWEAIKGDYPQEPAVQQQMQAQFAMEPGTQQPALSLNTGGQRIVYKNKAGTRVVVAGSDTVSVNSLAPYEGWKSLRRRFRNVVDSYVQCFGPVLLRQITVKYINRIDVPEGESPERYFRVPVWTMGGASKLPTSVLSRIVSTTPEGMEITAMFGTLMPIPRGWVLDLEVKSSNLPEGSTIEQACKIADAVHAGENAEFERSITDDARSLFR